jgi:hypothetical protein
MKKRRTKERRARRASSSALWIGSEVREQGVYYLKLECAYSCTRINAPCDHESFASAHAEG